MDTIDQRLLTHLHRDARVPLKTLAADVGLATSSVQERIKRLVASGVIRRYTIEFGLQHSAPRAMLMLSLAATPSPDVVSAITARPDVVRCLSLSGDIDLLVEISRATIADINVTRDEIAHIAGVTAVRTAFVLKRDKDFHSEDGWPV